MRRPSRRDFCAVAGAGLLLAACEPGGGERLGEGALDNVGGGTGGNGAGGKDGGGGGGGGGGAADMATAPADMASHAACMPGSINAGAASSFAVGGTPKYVKSGQYEIFVVRDAGGLFAVTALCTHSGCTCEVQGSQYYCPCHGATFAFDGSKPTLPAITPLKHYAMCVDPAGNVTVDPKTTVAASTRY